ncbi:hypothetical protein [Brachybacterium hainanense]|uniref:Uncharacterized protein n=1 Tax=Brachybacterium hainanense TaxID=1541174 RepID=A0ABV6RF76_9MICO
MTEHMFYSLNPSVPSLVDAPLFRSSYLYWRMREDEIDCRVNSGVFDVVRVGFVTRKVGHVHVLTTDAPRERYLRLRGPLPSGVDEIAWVELADGVSYLLSTHLCPEVRFWALAAVKVGVPPGLTRFSCGPWTPAWRIEPADDGSATALPRAPRPPELVRPADNSELTSGRADSGRALSEIEADLCEYGGHDDPST